MANETLSVKIAVDTSSAVASTKNLTKSLNDVTSAAGASAVNSDSMAKALNSVSKIKFSTVISSLASVSKTIKQLSKNLPTIKDLFADLKINANLGEGFRYGIQATFAGLKENIAGFKNDFSNAINKTCIPTLLKLLIPITLIKKAFDTLRFLIKDNVLAVSKLGDEIDKASQKAGMSAEAYQEWSFVFDRAGLSAEDLSSSMRLLQKNVATAATSGNYAESAFKQLGITLEDINNKSSGELFEVIVKNLQLMKQNGKEVEAIALATKVFGKNATSLNTVLNMTNEETNNLIRTYKRLGGEMSNQLVANSARLQDSITNLKSAWQGLKNSLATGFMPILNDWVDKLTYIVAKINILVSAMMGINKNSSSPAKSTEKISNNLTSASTAANKLKKTLMSFDELNVLNGKDAAASGGIDMEDMTSGLSDIGSALPQDMLDKLDEFEAKIEKIKGIIQGGVPIFLMGIGLLIAVLCFAHGNILGGIAGLALAGIGFAIGEANGTWDNIFGDIFSSWKKAIPTIISILSVIAGLWLCCRGALLPGIALLVAGGIGLTISSMENGWEDIFSAIGDIWAKYKDVIIGIAGICAGLAMIVFGGIPGLIAGAALCGISLAAMGNENGWSGLFEDIKNIWDRHKTGIIGIAMCVAGLWMIIRGLIIPGAALMALGGVSMVIDMSGSTWGEIFNSVWEAIQSVWKKISNWFNEKVKPVFTAQYWVTKFNDMKQAVIQGFKRVCNGVIEMIEKMINNISNRFNSSGLIRGINKILGTDIKLPTISIPRLAKGGIITEPTVAMMGEYPGARTNPEIVAPQEMLIKTFDTSNSKLVSAMYQMCQQLIEAIDNQDMTVQIGDETIAQSAKRGANSYKRRTGKELFSY